MGSSSTNLAPIALLAFKRPLTTLQTLYTLSRCPEARESELYVFCDAARHEQERRDVERTREVVRKSRWFGRVEIVEPFRNLGCARSVIEAITRLCDSHGRVIVVEDDLLLARGFISYMNEGLRRYEDDDRVMCVSGHTFDVVTPPEPRAVFLPVITSWGWATWARAWSHYEERPNDLHRLDDPDFRRSFDLDGAYDYSGTLRAQIDRGIDTWDIQWWWAVHRRHGIGVFPRTSLVKNIGSGADATHTHELSILLESKSFDLDNAISEWPTTTTVDAAAFDEWKAVLRRARPAFGLRKWAGLLTENGLRISARIARFRN